MKIGENTSYELLPIPDRYIHRTKLNNWHFPYIKNYRSMPDISSFITLDEFKKLPPDISKITRIDREMIDYDNIMKQYNRFFKKAKD